MALAFHEPPAPFGTVSDHGVRSLVDALTLELAGPAAWRVCDGRIPLGEGRFLAFVELKNDQFEVMQIADDFVWTSFETMLEALAHIVETNDDISSARLAAELS